MSAIPKDGYKPSPVYEAVMSDGETIRLSFYCPSRKPIDFAAGRRAMEAIALSVPMRRMIKAKPGELTGEIGPLNKVRRWAYKARDKIGGVYLKPMLHCRRGVYSEEITSPGKHSFVRDASGALYRPVPRRKGVTIVRAYVEHPSIGRVEHKPGLDQPAKPARKPDEVKALALKLCREFEGHCRPGEIAATVQALRGALGLPALAA